MIAQTLVLGLLVFSQLAAADDRYGTSPIGQPGTNSAINKSQTNNTSSPAATKPASSIGDSSTPSTSVKNPLNESRSAQGNPFRKSASNGDSPPQVFPLNNHDSRPITRDAQSSSTPTNYGVATPHNSDLSAQSNSGLKPSAMMRAMLSPPMGSQLRGRPVSLMEVISSGRNRAEQSQRVDAYWDMCSSVADYYLGLREQDELRKLRTYLQQAGPVWTQVESELAVRIGTSQRAALASQLRVASLTGRGLNDLPLPADTPHCASYITHYDQIFQDSGPAERAN